MATPPIVQFGRELITTLDLDPTYVVLHHAGFSDRELRRLLVAYLYFYHLGTAAWIVDQPDFYDAFDAAAASKEYKRSSERRHFRGGQAVATAEWLRGLDTPTFPFDRVLDLPGPVPSGTALELFRANNRFGPWAAFKAVDIVERLGLCRVEWDIADAMYDSPMSEANVQWQEAHPGEPLPGRNEVARWACALLASHLGHLDAPPRFERKCSFPEWETCLCKFGSSKSGHYHVGKDITEVRHALEWRDGATARRLLAAGVAGGLWK